MCEKDYMEKPCQHCPFLIGVTPFLHPDRAWEIASAAAYPHHSFACHKTLETDDCTGENFEAETSKQCAGMLTLRARESDEYLPEGFEPSFDLVYEDALQMEYAYQEEWERVHAKISNGKGY